MLRKKFTYFICIAIATLAVYTSLFYPGYLTADSVYILNQGNGSEAVSNWHPIFVTKLWGNLFSHLKSTGGIWIIQISLFIWGSIFTSLKGFKSSFIALFFLLCFFCYPPILANMAALWKDNWVVIVMLFLFAFFCDGVNNASFKKVLLVNLCAVIVTLVRIDYFIVIIPFVGGITFIYVSTKNWLPKKKFLSIVSSVVSVLVVSIAIHNFLSRDIDKRLNPWLPIAIWDIAGIQQRLGAQQYDFKYNCFTSDPLLFEKSAPFVVNLPQGNKIRDIQEESLFFKKLWFENVHQHTLEYLQHRWCIVKSFLGWQVNIHAPYPTPEYRYTTYTPGAQRSPLNIDIYWFLDANSNSFFFRYWFYLIVSITAWIFIFLKSGYKEKIIASSLKLSIFACAIRAWILPATDFRYGLWIIYGTLILVFLLLDHIYSCSTRFLRKECGHFLDLKINR